MKNESILWANGLDSVLWQREAGIQWFRRGWYWPESRLERPSPGRWPTDQPFSPKAGIRWAELLPLLGVVPRQRVRFVDWDARTQTVRWRCETGRGQARQIWETGQWELLWTGPGKFQGRIDGPRNVPEDWVTFTGDGMTWHIPDYPALSIEICGIRRGTSFEFWLYPGDSLLVRIGGEKRTGGPWPMKTAQVEWPWDGLRRIYENAPYRLLGAQDSQTGALTPGITPGTWSGHVFWDALYIAEAMKGLNLVRPMVAGAEFFSRPGPWQEYAVREGRPGWRWPWEMTVDGEEAIGTYTHLRREIHNQSAVITLLDSALEYVPDAARRARFLHAMEQGAAYLLSFAMQGDQGWTMPDVIGVDEDPRRAWADPATAAGAVHAVRLLRNHGISISADWDRIKNGLSETVTQSLDRILRDSPDRLSISPLLCFEWYGAQDPAEKKPQMLVDQFIKAQGPVFMLGHGVAPGGFPWSVGIVAKLRALAGRQGEAISLLESLSDWVDIQGDLSETIFDDGNQGPPHFATGTASVVNALHALLGFETRSGELHILQAWPAARPVPSWRNLRLGSFLTGYDNASHTVMLQSDLHETLPRPIWVRDRTVLLPRMELGQTIHIKI